MASPPDRPTYSRDQITQYFERLKLSEEQRVYQVVGMEPNDALNYLALLQKHHLAEIPFENLSLHYSPNRQIPLHHESIFTKIIAEKNGRGGYCMENNRLFGTLLYSLGFNIYSGGGRVFEGREFTGWGHMINLITIGSTKYHVDVGFGSNGPVVPMPLERSGTVQPHIAPASARLQWRNISPNTDPNQRLWVYEHRIDDSSDFQVMYCFTELEFLPNDYRVMNLSTSTSQRSIFLNVIMLEKKIMEGDGNLVGNLIMGNKDIKWRVNGKKEKEILFESEQDRLNALEEYFGIKLSTVERDSIRGLPTEIR